MQITDEQAPPLRHGELRDRPEFSGVTVRLDGTLSLLLRGRGLIYGPMSPTQMRDLAHSILATADAREARLEAAGQTALDQLGAIRADPDREDA